MYHRPQRGPPRQFPGQAPQPKRADSATNLFNRVWTASNAQHASQILQQTPQPQPAPGGWRAYDPNPTTPTSPGTPMTCYASLGLPAELVPPTPSPYPQPAPDPTPTQLLSNLIPWSSGSTSQIFRTVIKRPQLMQMYLNDELHTNAPDVEKQFLAELRAYQTAGPHKNIAVLMGCIEGVGMVLEQVDGDTLFERVLRKSPGGRWDGVEDRVNIRLKVEWFNQLVEALVHVHAHGLSHGDINSLNVLITYPTAHPPNIVKLIDFGRSTFYCPPGAASHLPPSEVPHPPAHPFAAPEILRGGKYVDSRTYKRLPVDGRLCDAYSLGVLLWCLDEERLVEIDQNVQKKEETVLFNEKDEDEDEGADADDESSVEDAGASTPASNDPSSSPLQAPNKKKLFSLENSISDEGYFSGNNDNGNAPRQRSPKSRANSATMVPGQNKRLFTRLIKGYMRRWEERTPVHMNQRMPVPIIEEPNRN
ncbi:hypothetical protein FS837_008183 [Tulasnella sp. UAMH 9824]|nr:hypothetical protein FS837_008183 [Tulasnella sp. UAMH 9824]